ncbi:hypothetical protein CU097_006803 [Rhizopus azygosporus]|uniref:Uncharacterized protein n=1 Tax=Rhizopus azygosporus TaxID=86630 RepID=A0A367J7W9_RHIAZ|nr:hypothetical protein CU097_006803 [Rhizopus azygosporus]
MLVLSVKAYINDFHMLYALKNKKNKTMKGYRKDSFVTKFTNIYNISQNKKQPT